MASMRLPVVCLAWGRGQPPPAKVVERMNQRQEAFAQRRLPQQQEEWRAWEVEAEEEAARRRQEVEEESRRRRVGGAAQAQRTLEAYQTASAQAQQAQQARESELDNLKARVQDNIMRRQRQQGNVLPEGYVEQTVQQQQQRQQQAQEWGRRQRPPPAASQQQAQPAGTAPLADPTPAAQGSSDGLWEAFAGGQLQGKLAKYAQLANALERSHENSDPYQPRQPRAAGRLQRRRMRASDSTAPPAEASSSDGGWDGWGRAQASSQQQQRQRQTGRAGGAVPSNLDPGAGWGTAAVPSGPAGSSAAGYPQQGYAARQPGDDFVPWVAPQQPPAVGEQPGGWGTSGEGRGAPAVVEVEGRVVKRYPPVPGGPPQPSEYLDW